MQKSEGIFIINLFLTNNMIDDLFKFKEEDSDIKVKPTNITDFIRTEDDSKSYSKIYQKFMSFIHDKERKVDTFGNITSSIAIGTYFDIATGLTSIEGILGSRSPSILANFLTGGWYGKQKDNIFKKVQEEIKREDKLLDRYITNESFKSFRNKVRKNRLYQILINKGTDIIPFNLIQVPIYATCLLIGSYIQDPEIDFNKVYIGAKNLSSMSLYVGPIMNTWMDYTRKIFGLKSSAEKVK
jgi:hypothetical protein